MRLRAKEDEMTPVPPMVDCPACECGIASVWDDIAQTDVEDLCEECGGTGRVPDDEEDEP